LAIGTSLGDLSTNGWTKQLTPSRELIHVDIDAAQIGRAYAVTRGIAAPAELFLGRAIECVPRKLPRRFGLRRYQDPTQLSDGAEGLIAPPRALWQLQQMLPEDAIFTCDSGEHFLFAVHYLEALRADSFMVMSGLGSMGSGICAAIGAQLAHP